MRLSNRDLRALITRLPELYEPASLREVPCKLLLAVSLAVPCFAASCDEWDVDRNGHVLGYRVTVVPVISEVEAILPKLPLVIHDHPLFPFLQERVTQPLKISDVATRRQYHRTEVYNEAYREIDVNHQMICFPPNQASPHLCVTVSRHTHDFTERDRQMLALLWPHLRQAHSNAVKLAAATQPATAPPADFVQREWEVVELGRGGRPQWLSGRASSWLRRYFRETSELQRWPETLERWIRKQRWPARPEETTLALRPPFSVQRREGRLTASYLPGRDGTGVLLLSEKRAGSPEPERWWASLPLSRREQDVFRWICEGKTNSEIGVILGISPHTVRKHVEHVLAQLGLENRMQAQRLGWQLRTGSSPAFRA